MQRVVLLYQNYAHVGRSYAARFYYSPSTPRLCGTHIYTFQGSTLTIHLTNKTLAYVPPQLNPNSIEVFNAVISMTGGSLLLVKLKVKVSFHHEK
jgi:hypothetical protein